MNIIGKKYIYFYFLISIIVIIPGLVSLSLFGLNRSIDFAGGSRLIYQDTKSQVTSKGLETAIKAKDIDVISIQPSGNKSYIIRTRAIDQKTYVALNNSLKKEIKGLKEVSFETIGPTVSGEITQNAIKAVLISSFLIVLYIALSFRSVPKPASSWRFGVSAIVALLHDVLVVIGLFSILGHFWHVEIDSLFVTAILTIIGFSVHDTIVVFDRIRENLKKSGSSNFSDVVNDSIIQTLGRSLNTSLTVVLVLVALLLFGGESIRWFVVALLVGVVSGTYSSIFNAAPLLVLWHDWSQKKK